MPNGVRHQRKLRTGVPRLQPHSRAGHGSPPPLQLRQFSPEHSLHTAHAHNSTSPSPLRPQQHNQAHHRRRAACPARTSSRCQTLRPRAACAHLPHRRHPPPRQAAAAARQRARARAAAAPPWPAPPRTWGPCPPAAEAAGEGWDIRNKRDLLPCCYTPACIWAAPNMVHVTAQPNIYERTALACLHEAVPQPQALAPQAAAAHPPSPVSAQKSSQSSSRPARCSKVKPSPLRGAHCAPAPVAACAGAMMPGQSRPWAPRAGPPRLAEPSSSNVEIARGSAPEWVTQPHASQRSQQARAAAALACAAS